MDADVDSSVLLDNTAHSSVDVCSQQTSVKSNTSASCNTCTDDVPNVSMYYNNSSHSTSRKRTQCTQTHDRLSYTTPRKVLLRKELRDVRRKNCKSKALVYVQAKVCKLVMFRLRLVDFGIV
jgi:hypothetical protein